MTVILSLNMSMPSLSVLPQQVQQQKNIVLPVSQFKQSYTTTQYAKLKIILNEFTGKLYLNASVMPSTSYEWANVGNLKLVSTICKFVI